MVDRKATELSAKAAFCAARLAKTDEKCEYWLERRDKYLAALERDAKVRALKAESLKQSQAHRMAGCARKRAEKPA